MPPNHDHIPLSVWGLLLLLSVIWGGSYLFVGIAVKDLSPLVIVMARVVLAAAALLPLHLLLIGSAAARPGGWTAIVGLSILNNIIPFTLIVTGQTMIACGLASVINATSPLFGVAFIAVAGLEPLIPRKVLGIRDRNRRRCDAQGRHAARVRTRRASASCCASVRRPAMGVGSLWAKMKLKNTPPLSMATGQLLCSSVIMTVLAFSFDNPSQLLDASMESWAALLGLSLLSTSFAYIIFFRVVARSGPANVLLVTMMIPVSAIAMGITVLGETLDTMEIIGTVIIILALVIIDGRRCWQIMP